MYVLKIIYSYFRIKIFSFLTYDIKVIYLQAYSITLHIPVDKVRSTRFGFHISQILSQKGTGHSLPLHSHTLFSVREKEKKENMSIRKGFLHLHLGSFTGGYENLSRPEP